MLNESLTKLGITDITVLPKKTQMKIADYNRLTKSPIGNDKEGNPSPNKAERIQGLVEDVIFEAKLYLRNKAKGGENNQASAQSQQSAPKQQAQAGSDNPPLQKTNGKGILEDIFGW